MSPERLYDDTPEGEAPASSDIWSLGICVAECALGMYPLDKNVFQNHFILKDYFQQIQYFLTDKLEKKCSPELLEFVLNCCKFKPNERKSPRELLKLGFITKYNDVPEIDEVDWENETSNMPFPDVRDWLIDCKNKLISQMGNNQQETTQGGIFSTTSTSSDEKEEEGGDEDEDDDYFGNIN